MYNNSGKFQSILLLNLLMVLSFSFTQCSSGKYFADFKSGKKNIDKLMVITPSVLVKSVSDQVKTEDIELDNYLTKLISEKTKSILSNKYTLTDASVRIDVSQENELEDLFLKLDSSEKNSSPIPIPGFLQKEFNLIKERYCMMIFFRGYYNGYYGPEQVFLEGALSNRIYLKSRHLFGSDIRLVVLDNQEKKIVYYDKKVTSQNDPRRPLIIEQMTSSILRPLYYK